MYISLKRIPLINITYRQSEALFALAKCITFTEAEGLNLIKDVLITRPTDAVF